MSYAGYADYMQTDAFRDGIEQLKQLAAAEGPAAVMCAEAVSSMTKSAYIPIMLLHGPNGLIHWQPPASNLRSYRSFHASGAFCS